MSDIPAELSLDVTSALAAVDRVEAALVAAADAFQQSLNAALGSIDTGAATVPIAVDAGAITADITSAVDSADATVAVGTDAAGITSDITSAVDAADTTVNVGVDADTSAAQTAIDELSGSTVEVGVEADTSGAVTGLDDLTQSAGGATTAAQDVGIAMRGADVAAQGLSGNLQGVLSGVSTVTPELKVAAIGIGTLAVAAKTLATNAIDSQSSLQRFNLVLGESAARVRLIDVGGLNEDLGTLANRLGADDESLQNATARFFAFGLANGTARSQVEQTTKEIDALAAHAVALNPSLGDVGDTVNRLTQALATGRNTADFGVSLQRTAVVAEALRENVGKAVDDLTRYDLAAAGAKLATDQLGSSLATGVNAGAQNVAIQFRAVNQEFRNILESAGTDVLPPLLKLLQSLAPAAGPVATAFASILEVAVPFATALSETIVPALETLEPVLVAVGKAGGFLAGVFKVGAELSGIPSAVRLVSFGLHEFGLEASGAGDAATAAAGQISSAFGLIGASASAAVGSAGNAFGSIGTNVQTAITARDSLVDKFQSGLPSIGDAFAVEAARVGSSVKSIDKSSQDLITAAKTLEDRFAAGLPSVGDAFKEGVSPEDLAKAKETLEAFIQGVEGVGKSAADAAQAVIDKATAEGGTGLAGFLQQLREQSAQIASFQASIATLRNRGALDLAGAFADRGIQSAADAAEAAGLSQTDLAAAEATVEQAKGVKADAVQNLGLFADELVATFGPKGAEAGATFGEGLVANLASPDVIAKAKAEAAKIAEAAATPSGGGAKAPQEQSLAGFLAALDKQKTDLTKFNDDVNKIADEGGTQLAKTFRDNAGTSAVAAAQAAALPQAALLAAEQKVKDLNTLNDQVRSDGERLADQIQADEARHAQEISEAFNTNLHFDIAIAFAGISQQIEAQVPTLSTALSSVGTLLGTDFGTALREAAARQLTADALAAILPGFTPGSLPNVVFPENRFGGTAPNTSFTTGGPTTRAEANAVNIENLNVTPPRDATVDEQAGAIAEQLAYAVNGFR